ncbi:MAG TPA: CHAT domain-containing tetratricopeptide repeat protein [Pyrinomonadaceae bacterium]|nr:CHAT domain-containing tetratricopeptide repeat protein [Pyrinomonadaceae bacterium]
MQHAELATLLVNSSSANRESLLWENSTLADADLAYCLKDICLEGWSTHPGQALAAAASLRLLAEIRPTPEIKALTSWAAGLKALIDGEMQLAISELDDAERRFLTLGKTHTAAATQVSKLIALSMLGRYEEAIECGLRARGVFLAYNDFRAAGKIEHNIGNLHFRRDRYLDAELFQTAARDRFTTLNDQKQLATVNNCLANTHALLHKFKSAEELFEQALQQAEASGQPVTVAGIEGNIGLFALLQGRYDRALDFLERSRQRYTSLGLTMQAVLAEHEIADAYLELNLAAEALAIYERVIPVFVQHEMRAEQARAQAYGGRALVLLGRTTEAQRWLDQAQRLYAAEDNPVGAALVELTHAQLLYRERKFEGARMMASQAEPALLMSGSWQRLLLARWLRAEADRALRNVGPARSLLEQTLQEAEEHGQPQIAERCYSSLGVLALDAGDFSLAEANFKKAVELTEELRAPIPGEEFRTAFFSNRMSPYHELARLCLTQGDARAAEALGFVERARSRALADALAGRISMSAEARDDFEAHLQGQIGKLREELNYLYNQMHRSARGPIQTQETGLDRELLEREQKLLEITRQLQHRGATRGATSQPEDLFSLTQLQTALGVERALVEYTTIDDQLIAFLVTNDGVEVVRDLGREAEIVAEIERCRFQVDALRYGSMQVRNHLTALAERTRRHLRLLYDRLLRPIEPKIGERHLAIVPHGALHYLPFHALHDGQNYLIERREVSLAPSAVVLLQCLDRPKRQFENALVLGVADEEIPNVHHELGALDGLFRSVKRFSNEAASTLVLREYSADVDVLHLACHAHFRSDSPLFSSLRLSDGWFTARDAYGLKLNCGLVTLSACETGMSSVAPGDELMGLARGFLFAGSPTVMMSLWTIDDEATAELMAEFYRQLATTKSPAAALRTAQIKLLKQRPHPFFWSPFVLFGRW